MNIMKANEGKWLTQNANIPIEERGFFKELTGIKATSEYFREATDAEVAEWNEYKAKQEEATFSDINHYIRKVGTEEIYSEAIDIESAGFEYEETEQEIIVEPIEETIEEGPGKIDEPVNY